MAIIEGGALLGADRITTGRTEGRSRPSLGLGGKAWAAALVIAAVGGMPLSATWAAPVADQRTIAPAALREDLRVVVDAMEHKHPALSHSVSLARFERAARSVERQLDHPMNQTQAWVVLSQLNSTLADGHLAIGLPDWRADMAEEIKRGTGFFPFEVSVSGHGYPVILAALGGNATPLAGRQIKRINGRDARAIAQAFLMRTHGDTLPFRAALLSQRWAMFYWKMYGTPTTFDLVLAGRRGMQRIAASRTLPDVVQRDANFDRLYQCEVGDSGKARMTVSSFLWPDKDRYFRFTHDCFARIKAAGTRQLVIDVSANGGGDDDMWKDGILRYIATRPYKQGSTYLKREPDGELKSGAIQSDTIPPKDEPLHYAGEVSVIIGPWTYSSAVLFSNVVQDYRFGKIIGKGGFARSTQTGGVKSVTLPNTGLIVSVPRFIIDRPSGARQPVYIQTDAGSSAG
jgi:hypothetical protein